MLLQTADPDQAALVRKSLGCSYTQSRYIGEGLGQN